MQFLAQSGVQLRSQPSRASSGEGPARGVQQSLRTLRPLLHTVAVKDPNVGRDAATPTTFGHNFSHIPIRPPSLADRTLAGHPRPATIDELRQAALAATAEAGSGERLPAYPKAAMEARFGFDLSRIRVHQASQTAVQIGANALTRGDHIWFRPGRGPADLRLLGHEVAHVVQQATGETATGEPTRMGRDALEEAARRRSEVRAQGDRGPIDPLPAQAGPALVQFDFDDDVLALLHRMPSADAEDLAPSERRGRIRALSERRERLRQLFRDLPPKEAINVRERLRTRIAGDRLSERFHDILSTGTRSDLVDILDSAFSIGPGVGRISWVVSAFASRSRRTSLTTWKTSRSTVP